MKGYGFRRWVGRGQKGFAEGCAEGIRRGFDISKSQRGPEKRQPNVPPLVKTRCGFLGSLK